MMKIILLYLLFQKPDIFKIYCKYYSFNFIYKSKKKNHIKKLIIVIKYICHNGIFVHCFTYKL